MKKNSKKQKRTLDSLTQTLENRVIHWKTTRTSLATAIKAFHAASVSLDVAYDHLPPTQRGNAQRLLRLDPQLASLESDVAMLCWSKHTLSEIRNLSTGAALINALPLDILTEIFRHTAPGCACPRNNHHRLHHPVVVSTVCSYWRRVAISIPALWSHIDFQVTLAREKHYDTPVTWIKRSKSHPLTIHIYNRDQLEYQAPRTFEMAELLRPFVLQIPSLHVHNEHGHTLEKTLQSLLAPLFKDQLSILSPLPLPIRTLSLTHTYPNWTNPLFQGLTYLRLEYPRNNGWNPSHRASTIENISTALSASSILKTLIPVHPTILGVPESSNYGLVHLEYLEILSLQEVTGLSMNLLLPILAPGPGNLRMEISLKHTPPFGPAEEAPVDFAKPLDNFFSRTHIETLKLVSTSSFGGMGALLTQTGELTSSHASSTSSFMLSEIRAVYSRNYC